MTCRIIWIILFPGNSSPTPIHVAETLGYPVFMLRQEQCGPCKAQVNIDSMIRNSHMCVNIISIVVEMVD